MWKWLVPVKHYYLSPNFTFTNLKCKYCVTYLFHTLKKDKAWLNSCMYMATGWTKVGKGQSITEPPFGLSGYHLVTVLEYKKLIYSIIMQCLWLWPLKFMFYFDYTIQASHQFYYLSLTCKKKGQALKQFWFFTSRISISCWLYRFGEEQWLISECCKWHIWYRTWRWLWQSQGTEA